MGRLFNLTKEVDSVSPVIAWHLVDRLFNQSLPILLGSGAFAVLGAIGYTVSGGRWYLAAIAAAAVICSWRMWEARLFRLTRNRRTPAGWVTHFLWGSWAMAAHIGAWSAAVLYEPNPTLRVMTVSTQAACALAMTVRNCTVRTVANGQLLLVMIPMAAACMASDDILFRIFSGFAIFYIVTAISFCGFLNRQTLTLLLQTEEKTELLRKLEDANQELEIFNQHLETLAATDALTGVANRRSFDLTLAREWRRSAREGTPLSLLLLDIDHFKAYNDFYGHQAGDECLRAIAAAIGSASRRPGDLVARYGGEEFAVILPATGLPGAGEIGAQILAAIADRAVPHDGSPFGVVSASIGAACAAGDPAVPAAALTAVADAALYTAKRSGRNQVFVASEPAAGGHAGGMALVAE